MQDWDMDEEEDRGLHPKKDSGRNKRRQQEEDLDYHDRKHLRKQSHRRRTHKDDFWDEN